MQLMQEPHGVIYNEDAARVQLNEKPNDNDIYDD